MSDRMIVSHDALTAWADGDPFAQLDHALAGQRLLSHAIAEATERRDTRAMRSLSDLSKELSGDIARLLKVADRLVRHD